MHRTVRAVLVLAGAAALAVAGCGASEVTLRHTAAGIEEVVRYDSATFALARDRKVHVVLFRQMGIAAGAAKPDVEYVFLELPEKRRYGWLRDDRVPAYRWTHVSSRDDVWLGTVGRVRLRFADAKQRLRLDVEMTMHPVGGTGGEPYVFQADLWLAEDAVRTQDLINRYGPRLASLVDQAEATESRTR